jgi:hypothetical protein
MADLEDTWRDLVHGRSLDLSCMVSHIAQFEPQPMSRQPYDLVEH